MAPTDHPFPRPARPGPFPCYRCPNRLPSTLLSPRIPATAARQASPSGLGSGHIYLGVIVVPLRWRREAHGGAAVPRHRREVAQQLAAGGHAGSTPRADSSTAAPPEPSGATSSPDWLPVVKTGAEVPLAADRTAAMDARETEAAMS